jgi:hypothetical protein
MRLAPQAFDRALQPRWAIKAGNAYENRVSHEVNPFMEFRGM